jgi:uncharacterized protein YjbJ (UPF0337 family)
MNWDQVEGKWKQVKGSVKSKWGKLTDSDLDFIDGKREQLIGRLQERYGIVREEAEKQVSEWTPTAPNQPVDVNQPPRRKVG